MPCPRCDDRPLIELEHLPEMRGKVFFSVCPECEAGIAIKKRLATWARDFDRQYALKTQVFRKSGGRAGR